MEAIMRELTAQEQVAIGEQSRGYHYLLTYPMPDPPDTSSLVTEDETPVDNFFLEKSYRLLTEPPYSSWAGPGPGRPFLVAADVAIYYSNKRPPIVPDVFLAVDVELPQDWWITAGRSYLVWEMGKPPDVAIEIVSNTTGKENRQKLQIYAAARVPYYVIFDPELQIQDELLVVYQLRGSEYVITSSVGLPS